MVWNRTLNPNLDQPPPPTPITLLGQPITDPKQREVLSKQFAAAGLEGAVRVTTRPRSAGETITLSPVITPSVQNALPAYGVNSPMFTDDPIYNALGSYTITFSHKVEPDGRISHLSAFYVPRTLTPTDRRNQLAPIPIFSYTAPAGQSINLEAIPELQELLQKNPHLQNVIQSIKQEQAQKIASLASASPPSALFGVPSPGGLPSSFFQLVAPSVDPFAYWLTMMGLGRTVLGTAPGPTEPPRIKPVPEPSFTQTLQNLTGSGSPSAPSQPAGQPSTVEPPRSWWDWWANLREG